MNARQNPRHYFAPGVIERARRASALVRLWRGLRRVVRALMRALLHTLARPVTGHGRRGS